MSIADIRNEYERFSLDESEMAEHPREQFHQWLKQAIEWDVAEPTAMTLATADEHGRPSARIVLLKGYDEQGVTFYTNYHSRKGLDIDHNPWASLLFFWPTLQRQIRLEGPVNRISTAESEHYFNSRPLASRIGAWASPQSEPITRQELEQRFEHYAATLGEHPTRPEHWGGLRLTPQHVEFWQGRANRLHDRLVYELNDQEQWIMDRLAP
ncbi:pyridoxamine 5'-phosphate oxidase [Alcaligenes endophyticus]|uniref:Pyridoxine/pyridoxamine 5'-phosphate oxidase n=1 Tax=Alcaligenes endophyticus TaxID=1929088 RepID=A0ABT8EHG0_9BURK|nr:pyridoxamine 5'-phosphate oxidase [Alcaligenes endophyticus]MCX5589762.1 pyridoxamine 5'-phosphate oxidase [Alcaligenes endophyticus]MDN4120575.1 pyridoxamine 5'-phosphate oxidase [Alcaligenes endophyticus]